MRKTGPPPTPLPLQWAPLVEEYLRSLAAAGIAKTTIGTRRGHLARIARSLAENPATVVAEDVRDWFSEQEHWARETRRGYRNTAAGFFTWAVAEGRLTTNLASKLPTITPDQPMPRPAPDRVWRAARMAADPRVTLMLRLAAEAGLRRAEVAQVHVRDLREDFGGPQLLVHGKGSRERIVPITDDLADWIGVGAAGHTDGASAEGWLFPGADDGHLSPRWVGTLCADVMPDVWTMHKLRHRFATNAFRGERNILAVQRLLGHASVATTMRYTAVDDQELRASMMAAARASDSGSQLHRGPEVQQLGANRLGERRVDLRDQGA